MQVSQNIKLKIKKSDLVEVIAGKDIGKTGKVLKVYPAEGKLLVERINVVKRHTKPSDKNREGGIIEKETKINSSNVMLICNKCNKPTRVSSKKLEDGKKVRVCKKCSEVIE